jgi:hypothetical protein
VVFISLFHILILRDLYKFEFRKHKFIS